MAAEPVRGFRVVLPNSGEFTFPEGGNPALREGLETTELLRYARRMAKLHHDQIKFLLELPASRRWLAVTLAMEFTGGPPVTIIEGEIVAPPHRLTSRELDVLTLVAVGLSNPTIAECLYVSPRTISTQVETIRSKLGAISRTAAGVLAVQNGWLRLPLPVESAVLGTLSIAGLIEDTIDEGPSLSSTPSVPPLARRVAPIRVGLAYPAAGPAREDGLQSSRGALLAIAEINRRGGMRGRPLEAVPVDSDIYTGAGIRATFATLRERDVHAVLMSYVFDEQAAFAEAAKLGVPVLHTMTSQRHLESLRSEPERFQNLFQCVPPETNYGPGLARFLDLLEVAPGGRHDSRTVQFIETTADSGQIANLETQQLLADRGWSTVGIEALSTDPSEIERLAAQIVAAPPTVLVVTEFLPTVLAALLRRLHDAHCPSVIYTIYAPSVPGFVTDMGEVAEHLVWATVSGTYSDPYGAEFRKAYTDEYGDSPGLSQAGLAYDMVHVITTAWQHAPDPSDVSGTLAALRSTRYRGVNGSYTFSNGLQSTIAYPEETNDPSLGNAQLIFQLQDGVHRCLGPAPYDDGAFTWPSRTP